MITPAHAFSGPWALNARGWLWTIVPTAGVILAQELATPGLSGHQIAASVFLQLAAVILWLIAVAGTSRLLTGRVVPVASGLMWIGGGAWHAIPGALVAASAGAEPEWGYRLAFWIVSSVAWMPLITYGLAQWDLYRLLLAERRAVASALAAATERVEEDADSRRARFTAAVGATLQPTLVEIRAQLSDHRGPVDPETAAEIAGRLDELARRTDAFTTIPSAEVPRTAPTRASMREAATDFVLERPVLAAVVSAALVAAPLLPEAYRFGGWAYAGAMTAAIATATAIVAAAFLALRPSRFSGSQRSVLSRVAVVGSALLGVAVIVALLGPPRAPSGLAVLIVFAVLQLVAPSLTATVVALWGVNDAADAALQADRAALAELERRIRADEEETVARLDTLVRGELNGLLAGSAMALAFLAGGDVGEDARASAVARVLEQLDAAIAELATR